MAILHREKIELPRTGFAYVDRNNKGIRKASSLPRSDDPTVPFAIGSGSRANAMSVPKVEYDLQALYNGYMADSYIHRGVNEFFNKILKEGYRFESKNKKAKAYIEQRFEIMTVAMGDVWQLHFWEFIHDYIKFGNAFLIKSRWISTSPVPGMKLKSLHGKKPIGGYFVASPLTMSPQVDDNGRVTGWEQKVSTKQSKIFKAEDVIHIKHNRQSGRIWGVSKMLPVLDDVRALRHCEEMIVQLIFKSLHPLIHHEVPDTTNTGTGRQEDVTAAAQAHDISAVNGYIVTPPGHKLTILGVESKALRAEGYLKALKTRVFAGLGLSDVVMGESAKTSVGTSDSFSGVMFDQIRLYQRELEFYINFFIIRELLLEGGFDPLTDPDSNVCLSFSDVDRDRFVKLEEHALLQYAGNAITLSELREILGKNKLTDEEAQDLYINRIQIPLATTKSAQQGSSDDNDSGQKGPTAAMPAKPTLKNKTAPKNQHNSRILTAYNNLASCIANYVREQNLIQCKPQPQYIHDLCSSALNASYITSKDIIDTFKRATLTIVNDLDTTTDMPIVQELSKIHGVFAGLKHNIL